MGKSFLFKPLLFGTAVAVQIADEVAQPGKGFGLKAEAESLFYWLIADGFYLIAGTRLRRPLS
jgi:hypothetical protein